MLNTKLANPILRSTKLIFTQTADRKVYWAGIRIESKVFSSVPYQNPASCLLQAPSHSSDCRLYLCRQKTKLLPIYFASALLDGDSHSSAWLLFCDLLTPSGCRFVAGGALVCGSGGGAVVSYLLLKSKLWPYKVRQTQRYLIFIVIGVTYEGSNTRL